MKRVATIAILATALLAGAAGAVTTVTVEAPGVQSTTAVANYGVETFDTIGGFTTNYATTFGGSVFSGVFDQVNGTAADQYGGAGGVGRYITVNGTTVLTVTGPKIDYFGVWASALDGGNTVQFYKGGELIDTVNLATYSLSGDYNGNPTTPFLGQDAGEKFAFFNFVVTGGYDEVRLVQNLGGGFELDNVTVGTTGAVPEPESWALLIAGLGLVGASLRRRRGAVAA